MKVPAVKPGPFRRALYALLLCYGGLCAPLHADEIVVAVAANFLSTARAIAEQFETSTGHTVRLAAGSTGQHYAQIRNGAPFDLYLAADREHPQMLVEAGFGGGNTAQTYAVGTLVLWSANPAAIDDQAQILWDRDAPIVAANARLAPYGAAADEVLRSLDLQQRSAELIRGENVAQAFQFVASGAAAAGFVAFSQVLALPERGRGSMWLPPPDSYQAIEQQLLLLNNKPAARQFADYLFSAPIRLLIESRGYRHLD